MMLAGPRWLKFWKAFSGVWLLTLKKKLSRSGGKVWIRCSLSALWTINVCIEDFCLERCFQNRGLSGFCLDVLRNGWSNFQLGRDDNFFDLVHSPGKNSRL